MGYTATINMVKRVDGFLNTLRHTTEDKIAWQTDDAKSLQYQLHVGLNAAKEIQHEGYMHLKDVWKISIKPGYLIAKRKITLEATPASFLIESAKDLYGVLQKIIEHKEITQSMIFTDIEMDEDSPAKLKAICDKYNMVFTIEGTTVKVKRIPWPIQS